MKRHIPLLITLFGLVSCGHLSYLPIPPLNFSPRKDPILTPEDKKYLNALEEKNIAEIYDCNHLGTTVGEGGGGLMGKLQAKRNVNIEAAKKRADTVVFGPAPAWHYSKTKITGSYFRCRKITDQ